MAEISPMYTNYIKEFSRWNLDVLMWKVSAKINYDSEAGVGGARVVMIQFFFKEDWIVPPRQQARRERTYTNKELWVLENGEVIAYSVYKKGMDLEAVMSGLLLNQKNMNSVLMNL